MMLGRVDEVDGHHIATEFFALLVPLQSYYVPHTASTRTSNPTLPTARVPVRLDTASVVAGYGRALLPFLAGVLPVLSLFMLRDRGGFFAALIAIPIPTWLMSIALGGLAYGTRKLGRLSEAQKERLRVLGKIAGVRVIPSKLDPSYRETKRDVLRDLMDKGGLPTTAEGILSVIDDIPIPALPLVYAYACYAGDDDAWMSCAEQLYQRVLLGDA